MKGVLNLVAVGQFNKGIAKKTFLQAKKHYTQMTDTDFTNLVVCLSNIKKLDRSSHTKQKVRDKETILDMSMVYATLHRRDIKFNIIEYNETFSDYRNRIEQRVLIRLSDQRLVQIKGRGQTLCNVFVVINLTTKVIVTSYLNAHDDNHNELDLDRYAAKLQVRPIVSGGYPISKWQFV